MNKLLFIGLNGFAGSGKDTVAKMLKTILQFDWDDIEQCKQYYKNVYKDPTKSATFNLSGIPELGTSRVMCIAYADQLKTICSTIFGIPIERFYMNKNTAWICINHKFEYTEIRPDDENILTADEFYYGISSYSTSKTKYWMSIREILVYVGTYVLQQNVNKAIFVNIVRNRIHEEIQKNPKLEYVITTDNRFFHELDFIHENNGITITITRDGVQQLDNIAEHELDDVQEYDYTIVNNGTYDELFQQIWDMTHNNIEFKNITVDLNNRDNIDNYLRLINVDDMNKTRTYKLCAPMKVQQVLHNAETNITVVDPIGGPRICVGQDIKTSDHTLLIATNIEFDEQSNMFLITTKDSKDFLEDAIHTY